jgi:3',5'-cyclic AMP phosphodiesterase CpdA
MVLSFELIFLISSLYTQETGDRESFTFVQICDTQSGMGGYEHDVETFTRAVKKINELKPDFGIICGDLVNTANAKSYADFNSIRADLMVPCYLAPGNHDLGNEPTSATLAFYRKTMGRDHYSFEHKDFTIIIANTQFWKTETKLESERHDAWFMETLKFAHERKSPIIVAGHYPLFIKSPDEEDEYFNIPRKKRLELLKIFKEYGVVAMIAGHTHKFIENDYQGIKFVNGETTSINFDKRPFGFRLWHASLPGSLTHEFISLGEGKIE